MPVDRVGVRVVSSSIHWLLIFGSLVLLGSGWFIRHGRLADPDRHFWVESHVSLGLSCAILVLLQVLLWKIRRPVAISDGLPTWRRRSAETINILLYLSLAVLIVSGYLEAVVSGGSISYGGIPLPEWDAAHFITAQRLGDIHQVGALVAGGLIFAAVALSGWNSLGRRRVAMEKRAPPPRDEEPSRQDERKAEIESTTEAQLQAAAVKSADAARQLAMSEKQNRVVIKTAKSLASHLRLFG